MTTRTCVGRLLLATNKTVTKPTVKRGTAVIVQEFSSTATSGTRNGGSALASERAFSVDNTYYSRPLTLASFSTATQIISDNTDSHNRTSTSTTITTDTVESPPLPPIKILIQNIAKAALYNQGNTRCSPSRRKARQDYFWDVEFCRETADAYERYLLTLADNHTTNNKLNQKSSTISVSGNIISREDRAALLSPDLVHDALGVLLKCKLKPNRLSLRVRTWERALGVLAETPLTKRLSLRLLEANGKSGNIGRVLSLLDYRTKQEIPCIRPEILYCIRALEVAGWYLRSNRNVFLGDVDQPVIDNPTRWLDAILLNMSQRKFPLTVDVAAMMLDTYASRGRTGKATHYFYSVHRTPWDIYDNYGEYDRDRGDNDNDNDNVEDRLDNEEFNEQDQVDADESNQNLSTTSSSPPGMQTPPFKVRLKLKTTPPYYKVPTDVRGKLLPLQRKKNKGDSNSESKNQFDRHHHLKHGKGVLKIDRESEPDWSPPLTAAFAFADSLTHGACGHQPVELNLVCYNILIKTCVYRGALWRAMHFIETVMPSVGITPDVRSYDSLLSGLARVGDVTLMRDYYQRMISKGIEPSYYTVQCIVDGLLNLGDAAGAITVIQDFFNQHQVLPPVETLLKVLEFALGLDMIYEAKRHVYFIQQIWKWEPHYKYESQEFIYFMKTYQKDRRISKEALQNLFVHFGARLDDSDFF